MAKYDKPIEVYAIEALGYFQRLHNGVYIREDAPQWVKALPKFAKASPEAVAKNLYVIATGSGEKSEGFDNLLGFIKGYATDMDELEREMDKEEIEELFNRLGWRKPDLGRE